MSNEHEYLFDSVFTKRNSSGLTYEFALIKGNASIFAIKTGRDGSVYGYNNKYLNIANTLHTKYGCSVIICSNPFTYGNALETLMEVIGEYSMQNNFTDHVIYYMGTSAGANDGARFSYLYPDIRKLLLINGPITSNTPQMIEGIEKSKCEKIVFVYGEKDPSYRYVKMISLIKNNNMQTVIIPEADHNFCGMENSFEALPDILF